MKSFAAMHNDYLEPPEDPEFCLICGYHYDTCECPECFVCGSIGDPDCYLWHGMDVTDDQVEANRLNNEALEEALRKEQVYWERLKPLNIDEE